MVAAAAAAVPAARSAGNTALAVRQRTGATAMWPRSFVGVLGGLERGSLLFGLNFRDRVYPGGVIAYNRAPRLGRRSR